MRFFAAALPGLGPILRSELRSLPDIEHVARVGHDGRTDIVVFDHPATAEVLDVRTAEDVFVEVTAAPRTGDVRSQAAALADGRLFERALSVFASLAQPLRPRMSFRVVVRVLDEKDFRRTDLRRQLQGLVSHMRPRWREADPAHIELWALQVSPDLFRLGLRLTAGPRSRRTTRVMERPGALRRSVAAAMVLAAGPVPRGYMLDPCCGAGTILTQAQDAGWQTLGADIEPEAVEVAAANTGRSQLWVADARAVPLALGSVGAVVSNLPFGMRFHVPRGWTPAFLSEVGRVVESGGPVVLLAPKEANIPSGVARVPLAIERTLDVDLLGARTKLWILRRT